MKPIVGTHFSAELYANVSKFDFDRFAKNEGGLPYNKCKLIEIKSQFLFFLYKFILFLFGNELSLYANICVM